MQVTFAGPMSAHDAVLCGRFDIPRAHAEDPGLDEFRLQRADGRLRLIAPAGDLAIELDLAQGKLAHRLRTARRGEPLPRAVGLLRRVPTVVDATAGLGRDTLVLATLGCRVTAIERIGALAMLLANAVEGTALAGRVLVQHGDARAILLGLAAEERPEVVYLDPMFAEHGKAQVQKDTQMLRQLAGPEQDLASLFAAARTAARERVVVKRPPAAKPIAAPDFTVAGGSIRFDVYLATAA